LEIYDFAMEVEFADVEFDAARAADDDASYDSHTSLERTRE
jgi:hypothetical protein